MMVMRILMIISLGSIRQELGLARARGGEIPHKWFSVGWIVCLIIDKGRFYIIDKNLMIYH